MKQDVFDAPLSLPTIFRAHIIDPAEDPFRAAAKAARDGMEPGALFWSPRPDRADCAVVLGPESNLQESLCVAYVVMNAIGDALGASMPAGIPLVFGWPDRIIVNGRPAGGIRLGWPGDTPADGVPGWMAAGVQVWVAPDAQATASVAQATDLRAEGCAEITVREILEGFGRHFLYWVDRWLDDGFEPVKAAWLARAANYGAKRNMELSRPWSERELLSLNESGDIAYSENGAKHVGELREALAQPTWRAAS